ncbi:expansin-B11 [Aegilops tauschii subsp. strangulata]|uniref:Expansin-B11 n=2 Tax=Aegilops tauschii subsp. strangulata TaxID=200361 RepID=A0A453GMB6_AEGTS|nr:expansin-B11 [Aegilops tauschii subsp. strangulata]
MAKTCTLVLLGALVVLSLLVSPIACSGKLAKAAGPHKPAAVKGHKNQTTNPSSSAAYGGGWLPAGATYYGNPNGAGSDGGACGYQTAVGHRPFSSMIAAGSSPLFMAGMGCGACYDVKCTSNSACSGKPVTVVITDLSPGNLYPGEPCHFDMSGTALGAMAKPGMADKLRAGGVIRMQYKRVPCKYPGVNIAFRVDQGSNPFYFKTLIEFVGDDGDLKAVALKEAGSGAWTPMAQDWGALWRLNNGRRLRAPFCLKLTSDTGRVLVVNNVIPANWKAGATYRSLVNYP